MSFQIPVVEFKKDSVPLLGSLVVDLESKSLLYANGLKWEVIVGRRNSLVMPISERE